MTASVNKMVLIGDLVGDPELRKTNNGKLVTRFSVATHGVLTDVTGASWQHTQWHTVVTWGKLAKRCQTHLCKGQQVYVEGGIYSRSFPDQEGCLQEVWELLASDVQFLDRTPKRQGSESELGPVGGEEDNCSELTLEKCGPHCDIE